MQEKNMGNKEKVQRIVDKINDESFRKYGFRPAVMIGDGEGIFLTGPFSPTYPEFTISIREDKKSDMDSVHTMD